MNPGDLTSIMSRLNLRPQDMKGVAQDPARMMSLLASVSGKNTRAAIPGVNVDALLAQIKSGKQRFAQERSLTPSSAPQTNRATLTMTCTQNRRWLDQMEQRGDQTVRTSYKGVQAHVSSEPLEALKPMSLSEMLLRKTYKVPLAKGLSVVVQ
ncbi:hypothetical protein FRB94_004921 [Tulasnella sp. JGI-2019a]|nr:hypothetical protein FRB94_004921 [Tulasnella sp. JGI-2019a]KAG9025749.1 hypothetical protein FRB95_009816 [Tulasnella sp. JGI-2019a]